MSLSHRTKYGWDLFEEDEALSQPFTSELLDLLSTKVQSLVGKAKHEIVQNRVPNVKAVGTQQLLEELKEAQQRIKELEVTLLEKDEGLKSVQPSVTNLEKRLGHEKRLKHELEKKFQEASVLTDKLQNDIKVADYELQRTKTELKRREDELKETKIELEDVRTRLSKSMGDKLTDNNPNIADLSDKNRPTKLAECYAEIYDNEWTNAFETFQKGNEDEEEKIVSVLISILMDTMNFCKLEADLHMVEIQKTLTMKTQLQGNEITPVVKKQLKDCRRAVAEVSGKYSYQKYDREVKNSRSSTAQKAKLIPEFVEACFNLCWLAVIQDPPVVFGPNVRSGDPFDTDLYKAYTKSGTRIEYVAWPALLLHEDGPVLCKGIAQGCGEPSRRSKSAPAKNRGLDYSSEKSQENFSATLKHPKVSPADAKNYQERIIEPRTVDQRSSRRLFDEVSQSSFYQRQSRSRYKPQNLNQYENYSNTYLVPTQTDLDTYFRWREKYGATRTRELMGERYAICKRYLHAQ